MHQESSFKLKATSYKGASGLMQFMPATARRFGVTKIYDPQQNIQILNSRFQIPDSKFQILNNHIVIGDFAQKNAAGNFPAASHFQTRGEEGLHEKTFEIY